MSKEIVSVSLGPSSRDYELATEMFGKEIHVRRFGAVSYTHLTLPTTPYV
jgi:hypothetical protein